MLRVARHRHTEAYLGLCRRALRHHGPCATSIRKQSFEVTILSPYLIALGPNRRPEITSWRQTGSTLISLMRTLQNRGYVQLGTRDEVVKINRVDEEGDESDEDGPGEDLVDDQDVPVRPVAHVVQSSPVRPVAQRPQRSRTSVHTSNPAVRYDFRRCSTTTTTTTTTSREEWRPKEGEMGVGCTYCGMAVAVQRFPDHVVDCHAREEHEGMVCPLCPILSDVPDLEPQLHLLMHLHDIHGAVFEERVARKLADAVSQVLSDQTAREAQALEARQHRIPGDFDGGGELPGSENDGEEGGDDDARRPLPMTGEPVCVRSVVSVITPGECAICCEPFAVGQGVTRMQCLCLFHEPCLSKWFEKKRSCPLHTPPTPDP